MTEIQRYDNYDGALEKCPEGNWVKHEDHLAEIDRIQRQILESYTGEPQLEQGYKNAGDDGASATRS